MGWLTILDFILIFCGHIERDEEIIPFDPNKGFIGT